MHTILSSEWIHAALANYQVNINNHNLESCFQFLIGLSRSVCWSEDENRKYCRPVRDRGCPGMESGLKSLADGKVAVGTFCLGDR